MEEHSYGVQLHLPGILNLLSENLYTDPRVALRELLQNAHDSCQRRRLEGQAPQGYQPRIDIHPDPKMRTLTVEDNGAGLTEDEIHAYLATIGRSYTAELQDRLAAPNAHTMIGRFGLGLLAAFLIAHRIEFLTRSSKPGAGAWLWASTGDGTYTLRPAERSQPGTTVRLHLTLDGEFMLNTGLLRSIVRRYADLLPVPVTIGQSGEPLNLIDAPWHHDEDPAAYRRYVMERFGDEPLTVLPLRSTPDLPMGGVLYIPAGTVLSIQEYGDATIYIRRMFITSEERDLLPHWGKFVRGVVESPVLEPTASREQVRHNATFYALRDEIEAQLLTHFEKLAHTEPNLWRSIIMEHNDLIKGWALSSRRFFDSVADIVTFETSRGHLTLPDYREASGGAVYFFSESAGATQEKMLYEACGLPVIDASRFAEEDFIKLYARTREGVELHQLDTGADVLFTEMEDPSEAWQYIAHYYNEQGVRTRFVEFVAEGIPAVLLYPPGSEEIDRVRGALNDEEVSGAMADMLQEYLRLRDPGQTAVRGTLYVNVLSPLMQRLTKLDPGSEAFTAALEIIYQNARFFAGRMLNAHEARQGFDLISYSVQRLVENIPIDADQ